MTEPERMTETPERIPRCPECGRQMSAVPYGWWMCPLHPWRMAPDRNHPDFERLAGPISK